MSYQLVKELQKQATTVVQACRVLDVSRAGYYAHRRNAWPRLRCAPPVST